MNLDLFNYKDYIFLYDDLRNLSYKNALNHFKKNGFNEGRKSFLTDLERDDYYKYNWYNYQILNPDLKDLSYKKLWIHWLTIGRYENRSVSELNFDFRFYINYYSDLRNDGINDLNSAYQHWINYGYFEKRLVNDKNNKSLIPKKIYYTCHDKNNIDKIHLKYIENSKKYLKDYKIMIYDDTDIELILLDYNPIMYELFKKIKLGCIKCDIFKYLIMYLKGGIYLDMDIEVIQNLDKLIDYNYDAIFGIDISKQYHNYYNNDLKINMLESDLVYKNIKNINEIHDSVNLDDKLYFKNNSISLCHWILISKPKLNFFKEILENIFLNPKIFDLTNEEDTLDWRENFFSIRITSGSKIFTQYVMNNISKYKIKLLSSEYFCGGSFNMVPLTKKSVIKHHFEHSWDIKNHSDKYIFINRDCGFFSCFNFLLGSLIENKVYPYINKKFFLQENNLRDNQIKHFSYFKNVNLESHDNIWFKYFEPIKYAYNDNFHKNIDIFLYDFKKVDNYFEYNNKNIVNILKQFTRTLSSDDIKELNNDRKIYLTDGCGKNGICAPIEFRDPPLVKKLMKNKNYFQEWRNDTYKVYKKYIYLKSEIQNIITQLNIFLSCDIAVHYRHPSHCVESGFVFFNDYFKIIDNLLKTNPDYKICIYSCNDLAYLIFKEKYQNKVTINYDRERSSIDNIISWGYDLKNIDQINITHKYVVIKNNDILITYKGIDELSNTEIVTFSKYFEIIDNMLSKNKVNNIFLNTNWEFSEFFFKNKYKNLIITDTKKKNIDEFLKYLFTLYQTSAETDYTTGSVHGKPKQLHMLNTGEKDLLLESIVDTYLISKYKHIIGGLSNMLLTASYINPNSNLYIIPN
jgi:mannosyltransferase OCH1-like enzyme